MAYFDEKGDLWIEVETHVSHIPLGVQVKPLRPGDVNGTLVPTINLTRYIADLIAEKTGAA